MSTNQRPLVRSNPPGTKAANFYQWEEQNLEDMESTLAVQQYIQQTIRKDYKDIDAILKIPSGQDDGVWKYEQLRQFCLELNGLAVRLQQDCNPNQCWQMTATDQWIFLCAAHKNPQECSAIDYTRHTLDGAACLLNSNKYFPSRVSIKESSVNKLGSVCRRVYRIFSHAYFHHRSAFDDNENKTYLCRRFTAFVTKYELMSRENLIVPIFEDEEDELATGDSTLHKIIKQPIEKLLNLPPGVGPDDEEELADFNFLDDLPDVDDDLGDDDFTFRGMSASGRDFGTMKPMRKDRRLLLLDQGNDEEDEDHNVTVIANDLHLDLSTCDGDDAENPVDESDC